MPSATTAVNKSCTVLTKAKAMKIHFGRFAHAGPNGEMNGINKNGNDCGKKDLHRTHKSQSNEYPFVCRTLMYTFYILNVNIFLDLFVRYTGLVCYSGYIDCALLVCSGSVS